jgi:Ca-activated chloride channel family protein
MPDVSRFRPLVKFWLLLGALALLIVMLARPQLGTKISHEKRVGIETIIAMDISNSMRAEDVIPSRLDRSKMMVENLVDHFTNDKIGLIVFAGDAFVQLPITSDYVSAKMFLSSIDPSMMATQGTDIARAIEMATHSFTQEEGIGKAIIVITDGENHEDDAVEVARQAAEAGIKVYAIGVGSTEGQPIPVQGGLLKDKDGQIVVTRLDEETLKEVAAAGNGAYVRAGNDEFGLTPIIDDIKKMEDEEFNSIVFEEYDEQFMYFLGIALFFFVLEMLIGERRSRRHLFDKK